MKIKTEGCTYWFNELGDFSKPMESLVEAIAIHHLSVLFYPNGAPKVVKILIDHMRKKKFWLWGDKVFVELNMKTGDAKITFHPDIYRYEINVKWNDFDPAEILNKFTNAVDRSEQVVSDFACRFYDVCKLEKNREKHSCDFDIEFDITNLDAIRCNIENGAAMAGTSFTCTIDELSTKDAQEVFDTIEYAYEDDEL